MSLLPVLVVGGAFIVLSGKKKKRSRPTKKSEEQKALPPVLDSFGEIFDGENPPDMIIDQVGSRFSVTFTEISSTGHSWRLSATPPDDSIKFIGKEFEEDPNYEPMPGASSGKDVWIFEGAKKGEGSIVFHLDPPGSRDQPPAEIVEIKTRIS